jgi:hypothetical protein
MKLLVFGICLALLSAFTAVGASALPPCGKVWVEGHYNRHGQWIGPHWKHRHWVPGHYNHHGEYIPGHCR